MMNLTSKQDALSVLYEIWDRPVKTETIDIEQCAGRILAEDVYAASQIPVVRASGMDGIAVDSKAFYDEKGSFRMPDTSAWELGKDYVRADTGDDFPDEYDATIAIEMVELPENGKPLAINLPEGMVIEPGTNVRTGGSSIKKDELLAASGRRINAETMAALAMSGKRTFKVVKKPVVAFIPTGSELVTAGTELERGQNYNSNTFLVKTMLEEMGAEALCMPIVKDKKNDLRAALEEALEKADIVVINGGSSKGSEDFNTTLIKEMGTIICHGVAAVPGRPMGIGLINDRPVVNLSGPTLAAFYGMDWCVRSLVCSLLGIDYPVKPKVRAILMEDLQTPPIMELCLRINLVKTPEGYEAWPVGHHGSQADMLATNGVYISSIGSDFLPAGTEIEVEVRGELKTLSE